MSGPKIDEIALARQKMEELRRQYQLRLEMIQKETRKCYEEFDEIRKQVQQVQKYQSALVNEVSGKSAMQLTVESIRQNKEKTIAKLNSLLSRSLPGEPDEIRNYCRYIAQEKGHILNEFYGAMGTELDRIKSYKSDEDDRQDLATFSEKIKTYAKQDVPNHIDFVFEKKILEENDRLTQDDKGRLSSILDEISGLLSSEALTDDDRKELFSFVRFIRESNSQKNNAGKTVINEFGLAKVRIKKRISDFNELYQDYVGEYVAFLSILNQYELTKMPIIPKAKQQFSSAQAIEEEIREIQKQGKLAMEQGYIKEQITDVMNHFGYNLCQDIVLDENKGMKHYLCKNETKDTAVHVSVSDGKQIMMEIVGTGSVLADKDEVLTSMRIGSNQLSREEIETLLFEQGQFCSIHPLITEELRKRGIILRPKTHQAPGAVHCKKILNVINAADATNDSLQSAMTRSPSSASRQKRSSSPAQKMRIKGE